MTEITFRKPIVHDGKTYSSWDFDPSAGALEAFAAAVDAKKPELTAMMELMAADGDIPIEVARQIRQSDLLRAMEGINPTAPLASSPSDGGVGEPSRPTLHMS